MQRLLFTLICLAGSLAAATTVYRWVDENGVIHYSDQPHQNAEKLHLQTVQTYNSSADTGAFAAQPPAPAAVHTNTYTGCAISSPQDASTFMNLDTLNVSVRTDPALHPGDQIYVLMDGQPLNNGAPTGSQFTVSPVDRGSHTLQALIKSSSGEVLCQSPGVTFDVHQPSLQNPVNPVPRH
jgi:hypothetical protein